VANTAIGIVRTIAQPSFVRFVLRVALAVPFWRSGILKWSGFLQLNDTAVLLFSDEFKLHLPGGPYSFPAPEVMAFMSGSVEVLAPIFLVFGLGTRVAALVLLAMTCIVELTVPDGWPVHITWAAMALGVMAWGPGRFSADHILCGMLGMNLAVDRRPLAFGRSTGKRLEAANSDENGRRFRSKSAACSDGGQPGWRGGP
jgi:putative oxidoreductase